MNVAKESGRKQGLTLIEVMLALVILGISLVGLTATTSRCLAIARKARNYENARRLLGQIELTDPLFDEEIEPGDDSGSFDPPYEDYKWSRTIEQVAEEGEDEEGLYKITMRVIWSDRGRDTKEEVVTYLYAPEATEGGSFER
ncbi:MAG: prepilin-type N-terminal cleavage/methylation domain-containing protein [Spartobacteria bacterium]|nr:prepilin-type N-terminal cleavage/methylation domain-containing protein [Spartobacteria bacterium]